MRHYPIKALITLLAACFSCSSPLIGSTVLYDNSGSAWTSNMSVSSYFYQAQSFRTGSEVSYLQAVSLGLLANDGTNSPFLVQLYDGLYPGLGTAIATLDGPSNPGTGLISYSPSSPVFLNADTTYWILARASNASQIGTYYGWRIADEEPSVGIDSGRNMYYADTQHQWVGPTGPGDFVMKVEAVPEPTSLALFALSSSVLVSRRRRPTKKKIEQVAPEQPALSDSIS
jgi:hypothetical protein